jgi:hypothetical protein
VAVADVILDNEDRTETALFASVRGRKVGIVDFATIDNASFHSYVFLSFLGSNIIPHNKEKVNTFFKFYLDESSSNFYQQKADGRRIARPQRKGE